MKFKVDENLPAEFASILRKSGLDADTVNDQNLSGTDDAILLKRCDSEDRVLITLDLGFADLRIYPPKSHRGIIVFRTKMQAKAELLALLNRLIPLLSQRSPSQQLWIVESDRVRYRDS